MTRRTLAVAIAAALCGLIAGPALAQNAEPAPAAAAPAKSKPKPAPKTTTGAATATVMVTNSRKADLVQLQAAESGSVNWTKVLGALKAGKQASAKVPQPYNCRVNLHGTFADGQSMDASDVDVCEQKTLNLTD
jgi:cell division septation protein DedD